MTVVDGRYTVAVTAAVAVDDRCTAAVNDRRSR